MICSGRQSMDTTSRKDLGGCCPLRGLQSKSANIKGTHRRLKSNEDITDRKRSRSTPIKESGYFDGRK